MKQFSHNEKAAFAVSGVMFLLFVSVAVLAGVLFSMLETAERDYSDYRAGGREIELSELEKEKNDSGASLHDLRNKLELAEKTRTELERRIGQAETELRNLQSSFENKDELYGELNALLAELQKTLTEKQAEIDALKADIRDLEEVYSVNLNRQMEILAELEALLVEGAPMNRVETPVLNPDGTPVMGQDGLPKVEVTYEYPRLAVYYEDLGHGYKYAFNGDEAFNSASCVKAPFALSVLMAASEEKAEYDRLLAEYVAQNGQSDLLPGYIWQYDFDQIFTYTEEAYKPGSGVIKDEEFGVQYSHLELFRLLLKSSDNVAFAELRQTYGTELFKSLVKEMGTKVMRPSNLYDASASDLGKVMKEIYRFTEGSAAYASFMKETMMSSAHTITIGYAVSPKKIAHKYGWDTDAYHDMAIVYDEHPYVLVVMSDMDAGGEAVNQYIQKVVRLIDDLHENFYQ